ncbi:MAG: hypothetical protein GY940_32655 [bacterium]|nr:hypothetical protein [bacterium]
MDKIADYAEDGDVDSVLGYLTADYSDADERSPGEIGELLMTYFEKYRGIAVNLLGTRVHSLEVPNAQIETEISLSSGAAKMFRKLVRFSGYYYRFKLDLVKEGKKWKIKSASWYSLTSHELFPESAKILKKLFPNL